MATQDFRKYVRITFLVIGSGLMLAGESVMAKRTRSGGGKSASSVSRSSQASRVSSASKIRQPSSISQARVRSTPPSTSRYSTGSTSSGLLRQSSSAPSGQTGIGRFGGMMYSFGGSQVRTSRSEAASSGRESTSQIRYSGVAAGKPSSVRVSENKSSRGASPSPGTVQVGSAARMRPAESSGIAARLGQANPLRTYDESVRIGSGTATVTRFRADDSRPTSQTRGIVDDSRVSAGSARASIGRVIGAGAEKPTGSIERLGVASQPAASSVAKVAGRAKGGPQEQRASAEGSRSEIKPDRKSIVQIIKADDTRAGSVGEKAAGGGRRKDGAAATAGEATGKAIEGSPAGGRGSQSYAGQPQTTTRPGSDGYQGQNRRGVESDDRSTLRERSLLTRPSGENSLSTRPADEKSLYVRPSEGTSQRIVSPSTDSRTTRAERTASATNTRPTTFRRDGSNAERGGRRWKERDTAVVYRERSQLVPNVRRHEHVYVDYRNRVCREVVRPDYHIALRYNWGPYFTYRSFYPYYHRKYVFVSLCGYWPVEYTYARYYWYGYHPYYWCGYWPVAQEVAGDTYNYYTYNYYQNDGPVALEPSESVYGVPVVDHTTFADVREKLAREGQEPAQPTLADAYFDDGVKSFGAGEYDRAAELFAKAMKLAPEDTVLPFAHCQALFAAGRYPEAAEILRQALATVSPEKEGVFYPRGLYQDEEMLLDQIEQLLDKTAIYSYDGDLQLLLGYHLLGIGLIDDAVEPLRLASLDLKNSSSAAALLTVLEKIKVGQQTDN